MHASQRYHKNDLSLPPLDTSTLEALQSAIHRSLEILGTKIPEDSSIYAGAAGIMLMHLRLRVQSAALSPPPIPHPPRISIDTSSSYRPKPSRLSPLHAAHGIHTVALLQCLIAPLNQRPPDDLFVPLQAALSISTHPDAAHEVLYGTAGLLGALVSAYRFGASHPAVSVSNMKLLAEHIVLEGRAGAAEYASLHGPGLPLMWAWHGSYYLGAIHGVAGILTILLQLPATVRDPLMSTILPATYALLSQVDTEGHLPSSLPRRHRESGELVQLCHGAPGALLLIAATRTACVGKSLPPELDTIETRLSDRIWTEGLLSKGISLCHGVSGNAWPWLLLSQIHPEQEKRDMYLGRALAFLLHSTTLPPLGNATGYRMGDSPFSLFEGIAGAVCAWSEACVILRNRLGPREKRRDIMETLGMPWLGGLGRCGF